MRLDFCLENSFREFLNSLVSFLINKGSMASLFILCAIYILIRSFYWDVPLIWDGGEDYSFFLRAIERPFDILNFGSSGHLSQGFFLIFGAPYFLFQRDYYLLNIWFTIFSLVSIVSFYYLLKYLAHGKASLGELVLMTALFAFHPTILSSMIHFTLDAGVITFFLLFWLSLLHARPWLAATFALLMIFSKETSIILLPFPSLFCFFSRSIFQRRPWIQKNIFPALAPIFILVVFLIYKVWWRSQEPFIHGFHVDYSSPQKLWSFFSLNPTPSFFNYLAVIFILNFQWVISFVLASIVVFGIFQIRGKLASASAREAFLLVGLFLFSVYFFTLIRYSTNPRYLIPPIVVMLMGFASWLWLVVSRKSVRFVIFLGVLALLVASDFRTIDPISKAYFGVFSFGSHKMLTVTRPTGENYGYGRDQLVYNLEFLNFYRLLNTFMQDLRPTEKDWIVFANNANWELLKALDTTTFKMSFQKENVIWPHYIDISSFLNMPKLPNEGYYLVFPNFKNKNAIHALKGRYKNQSLKTYDVAGYQLQAIHFW